MTRRSLRLASGHGVQDESEKRNSDGHACWVLMTTAVAHRLRILSREMITSLRWRETAFPPPPPAP